jgi:hypothetical protein
MPELRLHQLPHDTQYFLDGAVECGDITGAAYLALVLYADPDVLDQIIESTYPLANPVPWRVRIAGIESYGLSFVHQCPIERKSVLTLHGMRSLTRSIKSLAETAASSYWHDATTGGHMQPFLRRKRVGRDSLPTKRVLGELRSPNRIRRYVESAWCDDIAVMRETFRQLTKIEFKYSGFEAWEAEGERIDQDLLAQRTYQRTLHDAAVAQMRNTFLGTTPKLVTKAEQKTARKRARKAAELATMVLGQEAVQKFNASKDVVIEGAKLDVVVRRRGSVFSPSGHGALTVALADKDGSKLARLCVYQKDTPAHDQLVSLALHVRAGCEGDVINTGNLFAIEAKALDHPALVERLATQKDPDRPVGRINETAFEAACTRYVADYSPVYREKIAAMVYGRGYAKLLRTPGAWA